MYCRQKEIHVLTNVSVIRLEVWRVLSHCDIKGQRPAWGIERVPKLVKKLPAIHEVWRSITVHATARLTWVKRTPVHAIPSHFYKTHFNIVFPFTPKYSNWFLSLRLPHQNPHSSTWSTEYLVNSKSYSSSLYTSLACCRMLIHCKWLFRTTDRRIRAKTVRSKRHVC